MFVFGQEPVRQVYDLMKESSLKKQRQMVKITMKFMEEVSSDSGSPIVLSKSDFNKRANAIASAAKLELRNEMLPIIEQQKE